MKKEGNSLAISYLSCETDFVTANDLFRKFLNNLLDVTLETKSSIDPSAYEKIKSEKSLNNMTISEGVTNLISKTQENCKINFMDIVNFPKSDVFGFYLHLSPYDNLGIKAAYCVLLLFTSVSHLKK